jgi:hypothetical protein
VIYRVVDLQATSVYCPIACCKQSSLGKRGSHARKVAKVTRQPLIVCIEEGGNIAPHLRQTAVSGGACACILLHD